MASAIKSCSTGEIRPIDFDRTVFTKPQEVSYPNQDGVSIKGLRSEIQTTFSTGPKTTKTSIFVVFEGYNTGIYTNPPLGKDGLPPMGIIIGDSLRPETDEGKTIFQAFLSHHIAMKKEQSKVLRDAKKEAKDAILADLFKTSLSLNKHLSPKEAYGNATAAVREQKKEMKIQNLSSQEAVKAPPRIIATARRSKAATASEPTPMEE